MRGEEQTGAGRPLQRIAIFRALQLGDLLCTVPAWRAIRAAWPRAHITLVGLPWARDFAARYRRYLDDFIEFPGAPGLPERTADCVAYPAFVAAMQRRAFDLAFQMHGSGELTNPLVASWRARRIAGFHTGADVHDEAQVMIAWREHEPEVLRYLRLAAAAGAPSRGDHLEFPVSTAERHGLAQIFDAGRAPYACLHPGARYPSRRWPAVRFAAVADVLAAQGLQIVLTGATDERPLVEEVLRHMRRSALDLAGRTTLGTLAALVSRARLVVSNDTGMSHVAAAVGTPSVVISSGADVERWRPLDARRHRTVWHDVPCRPCGHRVCPTAHECARGVSVDRVLAHAAALLGEEQHRAA